MSNIKKQIRLNQRDNRNAITKALVSDYHFKKEKNENKSKNNK
jgi:hypothetical protein